MIKQSKQFFRLPEKRFVRPFSVLNKLPALHLLSLCNAVVAILFLPQVKRHFNDTALNLSGCLKVLYNATIETPVKLVILP
ncbi:MAG: hypothetical protein IJ780_02985 [Neisseriaceae bacterium]|nr:hypothetical protein [Neisseriaceae bacterium]